MWMKNVCGNALQQKPQPVTVKLSCWRDGLFFEKSGRREQSTLVSK
jgi:hypothetical protein